MYGTQFSKETAHKIWSILVVNCGANESGREMFVSTATETGGIFKYMFIGRLGLPAEFWGGSCQVCCLSEDETPERIEMICRANEELKSLRTAISENLHNNYKVILLNTIDVAYQNGLEPAKLLQCVLERMKDENKIFSYSFVGNNSIAKIEIQFYKWSINATFEFKLGHKSKIMNWQMIGF